MKILALLFFVVLTVSCMTDTCVNKDSVEVEKLINNYFDAFENQEYELTSTFCTEDYVLYDNGLIWNNDSLIKAISKYIELYPGSNMVWELSDFDTKIDCKTARTRYLNHGEFKTPDTLMKMSWVESAVLVNIDGEWKLEFLHSTVKK